MSEGFLAEARILVRPDTTKFRAELEAALAVATAKPIVIPIVPAVAGGAAAISGLTSETSAFTAAQVSAATETQAVAAALVDETAAATAATAAQGAHVRSVNQLARGAGASGLSLLGLRGATLAASGAFLAGTAAVVGFSKAVQSAASLETELNVFQVTAGATADQMARVSAEAKQLGTDLTLPGVTANDAAVALTELSKAGLSVQDSMDGARGALQLATAAQIDNVTATKLVAGALNAFQLNGSEAVKVADLLTGAAKESQGEISDMGTALSQVAAVSRQFGVTLPDTVTLLTELAQAGLSGGRAGTSLRVAFLRLINPTADAAKALSRLNIAVRDANGNLRPGVFTDIADALQGYTKAQRDATLATIFGSDAIRAAAIIGNKGTLAFLETSAAINEVGLAQQQAAARTKGLQGATENLKNQISALGLEFGAVAQGPAKSFVTSLADIVGSMTETAGGAVKLTAAIKDLANSQTKTGIPAVDNYRVSFGKINKAFAFINPVTAQFKILSEVAKQFGDTAATSATQTDKWGNSIDGVGGSISDLNAKLLQSAADSKINAQAISSATATLLQSAADSRIDFSKLGQAPAEAAAKPFNVARIQNLVQGFDAQQVRDRIAGDNTKLLADLQTEQSFLISALQEQGVKNRPALKRALEQALLGVANDIGSIQDQAAAAAKAAKEKALQAAKDLAAAAAATAAAFLNLRNSKLDLAIQAAGLTKGTGDDKRAINAAIRVFQNDIDGLNKIKDKTVEQKQAVVDLKSKIITLQQSLKSLNQTQNSAAGGFSLSDLFREGVQNFSTFGSNVAGRAGVLSAQDARASLGSNIAQIAGAQLTESQRQTALLESIDSNTRTDGSSGGKNVRRNVRGNAVTTFDAAALAAINGYG